MTPLDQKLQASVALPVGVVMARFYTTQTAGLEPIDFNRHRELDFPQKNLGVNPMA